MIAALKCAFGGLSPKSPHSGEKWLALTAMAWGVWLLLPFNTFAAGLANSLLGDIAPEWAWGLAGVAIGANALIASCETWRRVRVSANLLATLMWVFLAVATMTTSYATAGILYLMLGLRHATFLYDSILDWRGAEWSNKH